MKALIFDFDGTLADSFPLVVDIFHELTNRDYHMSSEEMKDLRGRTSYDLVRKLDIPWWRVPLLVARGRALMHERIVGVEPFPKVGPVLHQLHIMGYRLFIVSTNSPKNIEQMLDKHDLHQFFEDIYGNVSMFSKAKTLRRILKEHELRAADCAYIADEERDIQAAHRVGMHAVAVGWGYNIPEVLKASQPHAFARTPEDLLHIFDGKQV